MSIISDPTATQAAMALSDDADLEEVVEQEVTAAGAELGGVTVSDPPAALEVEEVLLAEQPAARRRPARRRVRGRYRSDGAAVQLELRVDVGGSRPMNRVSGDFFRTAGATRTYAGSFVVDSPTIMSTPGLVKVEGLGRFTFAASHPQVRVHVPRKPVTAPPGNATIEFATSSGDPGATYLCAYDSPCFRTMQFEQDSVAGVVPFVSYDTGSLPQPAGSPVRVLTVPTAYAEAGIEVQVAGIADVIDSTVAGPDARWDNSELHAAMVNHFSLWSDVPQWRVWLLVATSHLNGYRGIMFDATGGFQRQGSAVFYDAIQGADAASQRAQLRTYVHEIGHAFNLLHSWQKNLASPPKPLGPNGGFGDLSWMNYVQNYQPPPPAPGGADAYWAAFPFQFTDDEIVHLRHGFYRDVIMGGNPFGVGASEVDADLFDTPVSDESQLALDLRLPDGRDGFGYGEPVVVELKLGTTDARGRTTHPHLHPNSDFVTIAIRQPSGRVVAYRPLLLQCVDQDLTVRLDADNPSIYNSAYIGFGKDGFYFDQPGRYSLRAQYVASDGSRVLSPVLRFPVRPPLTKADVGIGELMLGDDQGQVFYLLGSDAPQLAQGNQALGRVLDEYPDHDLAVYARLVQGINDERDFKHLTPGRRLEVRPARPAESVEKLTAVVDASVQQRGVDNITLNMAMRRLAEAEAKAGNVDRAEGVMDRMVALFADKELKPHVMRRISDQAEATKRALRGE
jgi:hypothetical protein